MRHAALYQPQARESASAGCAAAPGLRAGFGRLSEEVEHYTVAAKTYGGAATAQGLAELQATLARA